MLWSWGFGPLPLFWRPWYSTTSVTVPMRRLVSPSGVPLICGRPDGGHAALLCPFGSHWARYDTSEAARHWDPPRFGGPDAAGSWRWRGRGRVLGVPLLFSPADPPFQRVDSAFGLSGEGGACDCRGTCLFSVERYLTPPPPQCERFRGMVCLRGIAAPSLATGWAGSATPPSPSPSLSVGVGLVPVAAFVRHVGAFGPRALLVFVPLLVAFPPSGTFTPLPPSPPPPTHTKTPPKKPNRHSWAEANSNTDNFWIDCSAPPPPPPCPRFALATCVFCNYPPPPRSQAVFCPPADPPAVGSAFLF